MEDIAGSAVAGLIAALTATSILGAAKWIHQKHLHRLDVKQIQEVLTDGRRRVMQAKETFNHSMDATLPGDMLRAAQDNLMIEQLRVVLDHTTSNLSYAKRKGLFDAIDWYHVKSLRGRPGWVRSRAWIWLLSSKAKTTARSGGST